MNIKFLRLFSLALSAATLVPYANICAANPVKDINPQQLVGAIDRNFCSATKYIEGGLIIDNGRRVRTRTMETRKEGGVKT